MARGPEKQFDQNLVLERAMALFWSKGYEATGLSELLEHMEIGRQSLYNTFGGKKELFLAALERYFDLLAVRAKEALSQPGSPLANLQAFFECSAQMSEDAGGCGCFMGNTMAELGGRDPAVEKLLSDFFQTMQSILESVLIAAQQAGEIPAAANPADLSRILMATFQGMALLSKIGTQDLVHLDLIATSIELLRGGAT